MLPLDVLKDVEIRLQNDAKLCANWMVDQIIRGLGYYKAVAPDVMKVFLNVLGERVCIHCGRIYSIEEREKDRNYCQCWNDE